LAAGYGATEAVAPRYVVRSNAGVVAGHAA
jgi:hypothetical protein